MNIQVYGRFYSYPHSWHRHIAASSMHHQDAGLVPSGELILLKQMKVIYKPC